MFKLLLKIGVLPLVLLVAACDEGAAPGAAEKASMSASADGLKPGITAEEFANRKSFPNGFRAVYDMKTEGDPSALVFDLRHFNTDSGRARIDGTLSLSFPGTIDAATLKRVAAEMNASQLIRGDKIQIPMRFQLDEQLQGISSTGFGDYKYLPNDCSTTLGVCKYTRITPDGSSEKVTSTLTESNGIWKRVERGPGRDLTETYLTVDQYGLLIDSNTVERSSNGVSVRAIRRR